MAAYGDFVNVTNATVRAGPRSGTASVSELGLPRLKAHRVLSAMYAQHRSHDALYATQPLNVKPA
jgi:hypothetical protein